LPPVPPLGIVAPILIHRLRRVVVPVVVTERHLVAPAAPAVVFVTALEVENRAVERVPLAGAVAEPAVFAGLLQPAHARGGQREAVATVRVVVVLIAERST